jgi:dibenzofuran dioxygenase alpha subunit
MRLMDKSTDLERGLVSRKIFSDQDIYRVELDRIFRRCWLFLGTESMISRPGDYMTNYMGEDHVIVWRDQHNVIHAFLNTCLHRGNKVCIYDRGRASSLVCSYHGWTYSPEGKLVGVPFFDEAYLGQLNREEWGLVEVPKVEAYGGLIFGCWDGGATSLEDYLGGFRWFLDNVLLVQDTGGLEAIPGCQKYMIVGNWKPFADNFAGDHYHFLTSHASVGLNREQPGPQPTHGYFELALDSGGGPPHGLGGVYTNDAQHERDLAQAERMGPEVLEWARERQRRMEKRLEGTPAKPTGFSHGNIFPNLNLVGASGAFSGRAFILSHPRGPLETEIWQWTLVDRDAPLAVKQLIAMTSGRGQAPAGTVAPDDCENFERSADMTHTPLAERLPFNYAMSLGFDGEWPGHEDWHTEGIPGLIGPRFWEGNQRRFYAYWAELMGLD